MPRNWRDPLAERCSSPPLSPNEEEFALPVATRGWEIGDGLFTLQAGGKVIPTSILWATLQLVEVSDFPYQGLIQIAAFPQNEEPGKDSPPIRVQLPRGQTKPRQNPAKIRLERQPNPPSEALQIEGCKSMGGAAGDFTPAWQPQNYTIGNVVGFPKSVQLRLSGLTF